MCACDRTTQMLADTCEVEDPWLAVQATAVLGALTVGFMASNGLL